MFHGLLTSTIITLATADGLTTTTKLVGALHLVLTNGRNKHHAYSIPGCVYEPNSPLNVLGVPPSLHILIMARIFEFL